MMTYIAAVRIVDLPRLPPEPEHEFFITLYIKQTTFSKLFQSK